jgi:hypothetical protein
MYLSVLVSENRSKDLAVSDWNSKTCLMQDQSVCLWLLLVD